MTESNSRLSGIKSFITQLRWKKITKIEPSEPPSKVERETGQLTKQN